MNYPPRNKFGREHLKSIFILVVIFISGAIVFSVSDSMNIWGVSPIWKAKSTVTNSLGRGLAFLNLQKTLVTENAVLTNELAVLQAELEFLRAKSKQADKLWELVGRKEEPNLIAAAVLTSPPQTPYDIVIIDAGVNEGVTLDSMVSLLDGSELGLVSEVFPKKAKVKLFSASGEETSALLERDGLRVTLIGLGGGNFKVIVPREVVVELGDRILSADIFARPLAVVGLVNMRPTDSFKEILAKSLVNIFTLRLVFVRP